MEQKNDEISMENLNTLVERYMPYIVRTVSAVTGRYVSVEHDDAFSTALSAFAEAVERYDSSRGEFTGFAGLVIRSRLLSDIKREKQKEAPLSLESLMEQGYDPEDRSAENQELREEIWRYQMELSKFGLSLETMAEHSPCHRNTRETAVLIAEQSSRDKGVVADTYRKRKLPVRRVAALCSVTEKIVKTSKKFILGTMLVFVLKLTDLILWIKETR